MSQEVAADNPAIGKTVIANGLKTNYLEMGQGQPIVLLHGSGPGVSAYANWRLILPEVAQYARVIAVDIAGFGYTELDPGAEYTMDYWLAHLTGFLDALGLEKASFLGNSFGGLLATRLALQTPERVSKVAMMGSNLLSFELTSALDKLWGQHELSREVMTEHMKFFPWDKSIITDDLVTARLQACARPEYQAAFASMFPAPRQEAVDRLALTEKELGSLDCEALLLHGREDVVVPVDVSIRAVKAIPKAQLHVFGQTGHWVMIERKDAFCAMIRQFFEAT